MAAARGKTGERAREEKSQSYTTDYAWRLVQENTMSEVWYLLEDAASPAPAATPLQQEMDGMDAIGGWPTV